MKFTNDDSLPLIPVMAIIIVAILGIALAGFQGGMNFVRREAIVSGAAEWKNDAEGNPKFMWKETK